MNKISFRKLNDRKVDYLKLYKWCQNKFVYEWFEQRILSFDEICNKYEKKLMQNKQKLFIIKYNADAIILRPFKRNIRAIKSYEKCGYKIINEYDGKDTLGNPEVITVLLHKKTNLS